MLATRSQSLPCWWGHRVHRAVDEAKNIQWLPFWRPRPQRITKKHAVALRATNSHKMWNQDAVRQFTLDEQVNLRLTSPVGFWAAPPSVQHRGCGGPLWAALQGGRRLDNEKGWRKSCQNARRSWKTWWKNRPWQWKQREIEEQMDSWRKSLVFLDKGKNLS